MDTEFLETATVLNMVLSDGLKPYDPIPYVTSGAIPPAGSYVVNNLTGMSSLEVTGINVAVSSHVPLRVASAIA
jgi:hypothetical protein